jgi:hypothetical protein
MVNNVSSFEVLHPHCFSNAVSPSALVSSVMWSAGAERIGLCTPSPMPSRLALNPRQLAELQQRLRQLGVLV